MQPLGMYLETCAELQMLRCQIENLHFYIKKLSFVYDAYIEDSFEHV